MVILRSQNKIIDFLMILAWASPLKYSPTFERFHILLYWLKSHLLLALRKNTEKLSGTHRQKNSIRAARGSKRLYCARRPVSGKGARGALMADFVRFV